MELNMASLMVGDVGGEYEIYAYREVQLEVGGKIGSRDGISVGKYYKGGVDVIIDCSVD